MDEKQSLETKSCEMIKAGLKSHFEMVIEPTRRKNCISTRIQDFISEWVEITLTWFFFGNKKNVIMWMNFWELPKNHIWEMIGYYWYSFEASWRIYLAKTIYTPPTNRPRTIEFKTMISDSPTRFRLNPEVFGFQKF